MDIIFQNLIKKYDDFVAVKDFNLRIHSGSFHFLLGPSGCGKTTILRMVAGLEKPSGGSIFFNEKNVSKMPASERNIGMVFQNYALWPHMTVLQNIEYGLKLKKISKKIIKTRVDDVLEMTQLTRFQGRFPGQLSGGQQQRVALARALAISPQVLLFDEPLSNLDSQLRTEMRENLSRIHKETGITTLYVTHDQKEALSMGSHISIMQGGSLLQSGTPRELYQNPKSAFLAKFIGDTNLIEGIFQKPSQERAHIQTSLGEIHAENIQGSFNQGEKVFLSIRPETIKIDKGRNQSNLTNRFKAKINHLTYLGDTEQLECISGSQEMLKINLVNEPQQHLQTGDSIYFNVNPENVVVLDAKSQLEQRT